MPPSENTKYAYYINEIEETRGNDIEFRSDLFFFLLNFPHGGDFHSIEENFKKQQQMSN